VFLRALVFAFMCLFGVYVHAFVCIDFSWSSLSAFVCERGDCGIYSIWGGRSLYCLHLGISQLMEPEACFGIFVQVLLS